MTSKLAVGSWLLSAAPLAHQPYHRNAVFRRQPPEMIFTSTKSAWQKAWGSPVTESLGLEGTSITIKSNPSVSPLYYEKGDAGLWWLPDSSWLPWKCNSLWMCHCPQPGPHRAVTETFPALHPGPICHYCPPQPVQAPALKQCLKCQLKCQI